MQKNVFKILQPLSKARNRFFLIGTPLSSERIKQVIQALVLFSLGLLPSGLVQYFFR